MADENLKDFTVNWILFGLLVTCLISFAVAFMYNNNPIGLGDDAGYILNTTGNAVRSNLYELDEDSDAVLNITSKTEPETSFLGSRDSVATSFSIKESGRSQWENTKQLLSWIFSGDIGKILIVTFGGIIGFLSVYYITKWFRQGS